MAEVGGVTVARRLEVMGRDSARFARLPALSLPTPCALVDLDRLERNAAEMAARCARLGVRLRPHVKTHKCVEAARVQLQGGPGGLTVSTLAEARALAAAGFDDLTWAVPVAPARLPEVLDLVSRGVRLGVLVDHPAAAAAVDAAAAAAGVRLRVWLKVDCGGGRAGVDPDREDALNLARTLAGSRHLELAGILTHAGHAYRCRDRAGAAAVAVEERDVMAAFADRLRAAGVPVAEVSVGSTPTVTAAGDLAGVTEVRPGNYAFFDAFQVAVGSCRLDDVAFSVLVTVIGHYPGRGEMVVDGGALALSRDPGPVHVDPACGFGMVTTADGRRPLPGLKLVSLSQEHGLVRAEAPADLEGCPFGTTLRVVPNHSCLSAALFDRYHVLRGTEVVDEWRPARGW